MKILGIDTTTKFLCLGIYDGARVYEYNLEVGRGLSVLLAQTIKRVLDALGWRTADIDYFACGLGPGSFTGMRVGVACVKGLSWAVNRPVIGIPTLDILAGNVRDSDKAVVPIIDAKRGLVYCAVYKNKNGFIQRIKSYTLLRQEELRKFAGANSIILGDAVGLYKDSILSNIKGVTVLDRDYWYPKAGNIIGLSLERIRAKKFDNPFDLKPIYLYPQECQIKSQK